ncbi:hypothetical protein XELAEV_18030256mg [Xenopus laevis]|uniref:Uncharacterized protein n=1 Tax=Xenopus laevis TaxID=8355 RepID=A0A974HIC3_XENLA|nr:hypothetical protein XELAEV_18030256mg [Xenopus laevis]
MFWISRHQLFPEVANPLVCYTRWNFDWRRRIPVILYNGPMVVYSLDEAISSKKCKTIIVFFGRMCISG